MFRNLIAQWTGSIGHRDRYRETRREAFHRHLRRDLRIESLEERNLLAITPLSATASVAGNNVLTLPNGTVEAGDERLLVDSSADSGVVVFNASAAASNFGLSLDLTGQIVQITQDGGPVVERTLATMNQLTINGNSLDNTLTVNLANGDPIPAGGLFYNGGDQSTLIGDAIEITGGDSYETSYTPTVGNDGIITLTPVGSSAGESTAIYFTSLEPILDNLLAPDLTLNGTSNGNAISYTNGPGGAGDPGGSFFIGDTGLVAIDAFETYEFNNKTNLILNGQEGNDVVTLNAPFQPTGLTGVMVDGGADNDAVNLLVANVQNLTIDGNVGNNTARIAGAAPGVFDSGNITFQNTALEFDIGGTMSGGGAGFHDQLHAMGTVTIGNNVTLVTGAFADATGVNFVPTAGDQFLIIDNDGPDAVAGMFAGLPEGAQFVAPGTNRVFSISYRSGAQSNDVVLTYLGSIEVEIATTANLAENGVGQDVQLTLSTPIPLPSQVDVVVTPVNMSTDDNDYDSGTFPKIVSFTDGSTTGARVTVQTTPTTDITVEADETLRLDLAIASGPAAVGSNGSSILTILNDDQLVVEFSQAMGMDDEPSGGNLPQLLVTGQIQAGHSVTIDAAAIGTSTATGGGVDFDDPTTVTVTAGDYDAAAIAIAGLGVVDDTLIEPNETIDLNTITGSQIQVGDADGDGNTQSGTQYTIADTDMLLVEFSQAMGMDDEPSGGNLPQLLVTGQIQAGHSVTIDAAAIGTSTATGGGVDFDDPTTVTVVAGIYDATAIAIAGLEVVDDTLIEPNETIVLTIITGSQIQAGDADGDGNTLPGTQYTIADNDLLLVEFSRAMGMDDEPAGGNLPQLLVTGQIQAGHSVTIDAAVIGTSTATGGGVDFDDPTTVTVVAGIYDATAIAIAGLEVVDDTLIESDETIDLGNLMGSQIQVGDADRNATTQAASQYTIKDDDLHKVRTAVTLPAASSTDLTITDIIPGGKNDQLELTIVRDIIQGDRLVITDLNNIIGDFTDNTTGIIVDVPLTLIRSVEIDLKEGDDQLSIKLDNAPLDLSLTVKGGGGHDTLVFMGTTSLDSRDVTATDGIEDIFVNGSIMTSGGDVTLGASQSLEVNAAINTDLGGEFHLTAGLDVFGNCSLITGETGTVEGTTGIAGIRVVATEDVMMKSTEGGITGCDGQIDVEAQTATLLARTGIGSALVEERVITSRHPLETAVVNLDASAGGIGMFIANDSLLTSLRATASVPPGNIPGFPYGIIDIAATGTLTVGAVDGNSIFLAVTAGNEILALNNARVEAVNSITITSDVEPDVPEGTFSPHPKFLMPPATAVGQPLPEGEARWHNVTNPLDVNDDGYVSSLDVLKIVNHINAFGNSALAEGEESAVDEEDRRYVDVNGDGFATPRDALRVINSLNRASGAEGEGLPAPRIDLYLQGEAEPDSFVVPVTLLDSAWTIEISDAQPALAPAGSGPHVSIRATSSAAAVPRSQTRQPIGHLPPERLIRPKRTGAPESLSVEALDHELEILLADIAADVIRSRQQVELFR